MGEQPDLGHLDAMVNEAIAVVSRAQRQLAEALAECVGQDEMVRSVAWTLLTAAHAGASFSLDHLQTYLMWRGLQHEEERSESHG